VHHLRNSSPSPSFLSEAISYCRAANYIANITRKS
jgi:hypothetical protein